MGVCKCDGYSCPDGIWDRGDLIGAHVRVNSMPGINFSAFQDADKVCTISDIYFRVTLDGKTTTIIKLAEYPKLIFTWRDLEIVEVLNKVDK